MSTLVAALLGTMLWSLITYYFGIPVSETHGLIGSIIGASVAASGIKVIVWSGLAKVLVAIVVSPLLGFAGGALLMLLIYLFAGKGPSAGCFGPFFMASESEVDRGKDGQPLFEALSISTILSPRLRPPSLGRRCKGDIPIGAF